MSWEELTHSGCRMPTCMDMAAATWPRGLKVEGAPTWPGYATSEGRAWSLEGCGLSAAGPTESRPPSMPHPLGRGLGQLKWGHAAWPFSALLSLPGREQPQTCSRGWSRWLESWVQLPSALPRSPLFLLLQSFPASRAFLMSTIKSVQSLSHV